MKNLVLLVIMLLSLSVWAQKARIAVFGFETLNIQESPEGIADLVRYKLQSVTNYTVLNQHDMRDLIDTNPNECLSITCLSENGKKLNANYAITGFVRKFNNKIVVNLRSINVAEATVDQDVTGEYINSESSLEIMISITLKKLFGLPVDESLEKSLVFSEQLYNDQLVQKLRNSGPRMGIQIIGGDMAQRVSDSNFNGGLGADPYFTQFGYQFEQQYLSTGHFQALVEEIVLVGGLDQGLFIPSVTIFNGFRDSKSGFEFGFGPSFSFRKERYGYFENGNWYTVLDVPVDDYLAQQNAGNLVSRLDTRGDLKIASNWVWSVGKTFRSGNLNFPVNLYGSYRDNSWFLGASFGFNIRKS